MDHVGDDGGEMVGGCWVLRGQELWVMVGRLWGEGGDAMGNSGSLWGDGGGVGDAGVIVGWLWGC